MTATPKDQQGESQPCKKRYEPPRLEVYGDVREIARNVGLAGMFDGVLVLRTH
jgi:hypothetical protein